MTDKPDIQHLRQAIIEGDLDAALSMIKLLKGELDSNTEFQALAANVYRRKYNLPTTIEYMARAVETAPHNSSLLYSYAKDLFHIGRLENSRAILNKLPGKIQRDPNVMLLKSQIAYQEKDYVLSADILRTLLKQHPKFPAAHMDLAHALLMQGDWHPGWQEYEWRYRLAKTRELLPRFKMPHWDGREGLEHILLIADQGYGDCFQFSRYIPMVAAICKKVTLIRSEPLARLFDSVPGIDATVTKWEDTPLTDAYCTLSGLPRLFDTTPSTIPGNQDIIKADSNDISRWKEKLNESAPEVKLKIGIAWTGRQEFGNNYLRAVPISSIEPLLDITECGFFSLQVGPCANQGDESGIINISNDLTDFAETAAAMQALDLIITSDTSIAHLAAALNRPTWVMLGYSPDWRWGENKSTSDWYPSARLFRQDKIGNWADVINDIKHELQLILNPTAGK